jgi:LytS/YehU family sensor histidine kinase
VRAARLRTEIVQAQLHAIRMQIHPHFLFNTLHTISALVQGSPALAERMIARLSDLLRLTLETGKNSEITLGDEMRLIELYLEIERTRYEERLAVDIRVPDEMRSALVPNFILQPIVENAIRHGIAKSSARGSISIFAEKYGSNLVLKVRNTGPGLLRHSREGVGVSATKSRLECLYGARQQFVLGELTPGLVEASIVLPFATADSQRTNHVEYSDADRGRREVGAGAAAPALER